MQGCGPPGVKKKAHPRSSHFLLSLMSHPQNICPSWASANGLCAGGCTARNGHCSPSSRLQHVETSGSILFLQWLPDHHNLNLHHANIQTQIQWAGPSVGWLYRHTYISDAVRALILYNTSSEYIAAANQRFIVQDAMYLFHTLYGLLCSIVSIVTFTGWTFFQTNF